MQLKLLIYRKNEFGLILENSANLTLPRLIYNKHEEVHFSCVTDDSGLVEFKVCELPRSDQLREAKTAPMGQILEKQVS